MARSSLAEPLDKYRWKVIIDGFTRAGFVRCNTPSFRMSNHSYPEGGAHLNPRQIMNSIEYPPVTFERGVTPDTSFNKWATGLFDVIQDNDGLDTGSEAGEFVENTFGADVGSFIQRAGLTGPTPIPAFNNKGEYRKTVTIKHTNRAGQTIVEYILYGAWVSTYKPASDFDSSDDEGFSIESITLSYDGFEVRYGGVAGAAASGLIQSIT